MNLQAITELMTRLGPETPGIDEVERSSDDHWTIALSSGVVVMLRAAVEPAAPAAALLVSTLVGRPPVDRRHLVYESMLAFNALSQPGSAVTLGLDGPDGEVVLMFNRSASGITLDEMSRTLARFVDLADMWAQYVSAVEPAAEPYRSPLLMTMLV